MLRTVHPLPGLTEWVLAFNVQWYGHGGSYRKGHAMRNLPTRIALTPPAVLLVLAAAVHAQNAAEEKPAPTSFEELEAGITGILEETATPGVGIAVVSPDEILWIAGIGKADVASGRPATAETLFRIGSTSKGFVSLAVLKLQEEGRLSLDDTLRERAPEIEFVNRWEETDPVRLVHLLEHTSGFDDIHLAEYASNDPKPVTLREGLDHHPDSRITRWRPGTRFSYCNSGPAAAAYVVEKVTGQRFEDYVQASFFEPIGMTSATYFLTEEVERGGATLYQADGMTPNPYWHISMRPSGAINASARDMAAYLRFYLQRGSLDGQPLLSQASIERMERATSTWGAQAGLGAGYGLSNYTSAEQGFVFHGHEGGVNGGLTEMAYLPEHGLGYAFMINSGNGESYSGISDLVRGFLVRNLPEPRLPTPAMVPTELASIYAGFYIPASPRAAVEQFADNIVGQVRLSTNGESLHLEPLLVGDARDYVAVTDRLARRSGRSLTSLALLETGNDATFIEADSQTFRRIPGWIAWGKIVWLAMATFLLATSILFALVWVPRRLFGRLKIAPHLSVRVWPLVSILALVGFVAIFVVGLADAIPRLGQVTVYSVGQMVLSIVFAATALWALVAVLRARNARMNRIVWWHSLVVAASANSIALYLLYWGLIGLRTWSY